MKDRNIKLIAIIIALLLIASVAVSFIIKSSKKDNSSTYVQHTVTSTPTPDGIWIVDPPADAYSSSYSASSSDYENVPEGITIVDPPLNYYTSENNGNNGIYVIETPYNGGGSGVYVIETPTPGGGGGGGSSSGVNIGSGSFSSSTGTGLNMTVSYSAVTSSSTTVDIIMTARLSHGNLSSKSSSVSFNCAGQYGSASARAISGTGPTDLGSRTFTINLSPGQSSTVSMSASWPFGGTYSGTYIDTVSASTSVTLSR